MRKVVLIFFIVVMAFACKKAKQEINLCDYEAIIARDTLVAATLYGSSSYFTFKDEAMGFDYELCAQFAQAHNLVLKMIVASSEPELIELLKNDAVDLVAYRLSVRNELKSSLLYIDNEYINNQVLIQRNAKSMISSVVDLIGKELVVLPGTKYEERMHNLNDELGGGILIKQANDTLTIDNLIEMVSNGAIDYTVAENDIALLNKTYFHNLDCKISVSFNQRAAWAVPKSCPALKDTLNQWFASEGERKHYDALYNKYFVRSKFFSDRKIHIPKGAISPYDNLFKQYALLLGWDWELLAAQCYAESKFDSSAVSWAGARGVMQLMPRTAAGLGLNDSSVSNPAANIEAATRYIKILDRRFWKITDRQERIKFVLASYNAGDGHITDAMALAEKYGKNPHIWHDNVETYMLLKSQKEYYADPIVKHGYFRGKETSHYVREVQEKYEKYKRRK